MNKKSLNKRFLYIQISVLAIISIVLFLVPLIIESNYVKSILTKMLVYVLLSCSLNVINGFSGQFNIGHGGFYAIGAYTYAILATRLGINFWLGMLLSGIMAGIIGYLVSLPTLKLKGFYLAMVTLGAAEIIRLIILNWTGLTEGAMGIKGIPQPSLFGIPLNRTDHFYIIILSAVIIMNFITYRIIKSRIGRAWISIREDQNAARFLAVEVNRQKSINFIYGAFWAGVAGCIAASFYQYISPGNFTLNESFKILLMVVLGGQGTFAGPIIGAILVGALTEFLRFAVEYRMVIFSVLVIIMLWFRPDGLISFTKVITDRISFLRQKKEGAIK